MYVQPLITLGLTIHNCTHPPRYTEVYKKFQELFDVKIEGVLALQPPLTLQQVLSCV